MTPITVIKRNALGEETWRYSGELLRQEGSAYHLEARFNGKDVSFMGTLIRARDRFIETYYSDRWYNIFEIHDREDDALKGWYCNIGRPAVMESEGVISYEDLALDLWVTPEGTQMVLDEDEFAALPLDAGTRQRARAALAELQERFSSKQEPGRF
jgi:uncharacterized protein